jgi:DNA-binding CsgD family transcriptional regulator
MMFDPRDGVVHTSNEASASPSARRRAWAALACGRYTLTAHEGRAGDRIYLMTESSQEARAARRLTRAEAKVADAAARAYTGKVIAHTLGLARSTVSMALASATWKVGLTSSAELSRLLHALLCDERDALDATHLSAAEREVLAHVLEGKSNAAIARTRGRSVRTIANQVASILRKTRSPSRRALRMRS